MTTTTDENLSAVDQLKRLFDRYHRKQITLKSFKYELIFYAQTVGFIDNTYRKQAWDVLINTSGDTHPIDEKQTKSHQYYEQTKLDVIRTLKRFPPNYSDSERSQLQDELIHIIAIILVKHDELHYYQGYHDISLTFLLVLGKERCLPLLESITMSHLKYFMEPTMEKTRDALSYLMTLINCINSECAEYMERADVGHVIFALPWFITWYSHVLEDLDIILRLYDLFIVSHYLMPIYIAAEIVNYHADEVLSRDCEMSAIHQYLSALPTEIDGETWEEIIKRAFHLFKNHPPDTLDDLHQAWNIKCEHIQKSPGRSMNRQLSSRNSTNNNRTSVSSQRINLTRIAYWVVPITIGLAIYFSNTSKF